MSNGAKWRPGKRLTVEVYLLGRFMHFISPLATFEGSFALRVREDARHCCSMRLQVQQKTVFFEQSFAVTHTAMMPFDKHPAARCLNHAGRGKRPWAHAQKLCELTTPGELSKQRTRLAQRQRSPIRFDQRSIHPVRLRRSVHRKFFLHASGLRQKSANLERVMRREPHCGWRTEPDESITVTGARVAPIALVGDIVGIK